MTSTPEMYLPNGKGNMLRNIPFAQDAATEYTIFTLKPLHADQKPASCRRYRMVFRNEDVMYFPLISGEPPR